MYSVSPPARAYLTLLLPCGILLMTTMPSWGGGHALATWSGEFFHWCSLPSFMLWRVPPATASRLSAPAACPFLPSRSLLAPHS